MAAIDPLPTESNASIELHDSDLDGIDQTPTALSLRLRAYVHRSNGSRASTRARAGAKRQP